MLTFEVATLASAAHDPVVVCQLPCQSTYEFKSAAMIELLPMVMGGILDDGAFPVPVASAACVVGVVVPVSVAVVLVALLSVDVSVRGLVSDVTDLCTYSHSIRRCNRRIRQDRKWRRLKTVSTMRQLERDEISHHNTFRHTQHRCWGCRDRLLSQLDNRSAQRMSRQWGNTRLRRS